MEPILRAMSGGQRLAGTSVHNSVAHEIGSRIVRGDFPEGGSLPNEAQWAEYFGVSRSAIREAIKILMAKGLLSSRPKVGTWVESRDRWNLLDRDVLSWYASAPDAMGFLRTVQEFRYIIEPEAAALAAERRTEEEVVEITRALNGMGNAPTLSDRTRSDTQFHLAILKATHNELLIPLGTLIESALNNLFVYVTREANSLRYAQELHAAIEEQIRLQRPEAARGKIRVGVWRDDPWTPEATTRFAGATSAPFRRPLPRSIFPDGGLQGRDRARGLPTKKRTEGFAGFFFENHLTK